MTTFLQAGLAVLSTQAGYDAFMGAIDAQIVALGWVLTADTGQTAQAAVALPLGGATSGYRVYKTNDVFTTIFMRVDFFRGNNTEPNLKFTCGYSTDGAGNIGSQKSAVFNVLPGETGASQQLAMSGTPSRLTIAWAADSAVAGKQLCFGFERDKDINGNDTDNGFLMYSAALSAGQEFVPKTGTIPPAEASIVVSHPSSTSTAIIGANTLVSAPMPIKETGGGNPGLGCCVYTGTNFSNNTVATITRYGNSVNYLVVVTGPNIYGGNAAFHTMWRYE